MVFVPHLIIPASHQDGLVSMEMLSVHLYGDISQDIPATEAVEIEKDITCMARKLNTAICSHRHSVQI